MGAEAECTARWLEDDDPRVLLDAEFECDTYGFASHGLTTSVVGGSAIVAVADDFREWIVQASADAVVPLPGGPETFGRQRVWTSRTADGELLVTGTARSGNELMWEVWTFQGEWRQLTQTTVPLGTLVTGLDTSPQGDIATWLDVDEVPMIARAQDRWTLRKALELPNARRGDAALSAEGVEVVVGHASTESPSSDQLLVRIADEGVRPLGDPSASPIEFTLAAPTRGRAFAPNPSSFAVLAGTFDTLAASWPTGTAPIPEGAMATEHCTREWGEVSGSGECEDCTEKGTGRFGQLVAVARTDDDRLLVAYVHAALDRSFDYNFWCTDPDGEYCSCETLYWDEGSSFELRLVALGHSGEVTPLLAREIAGHAYGRESTSPRDIALDTRGERVAIAVHFATSTVRVLLLDISDLGDLSG